MKVLIVPDKFKGTLSAHDAAEAIAAGWLSVRPGDEVVRVPMSDGGDGFGSVLASQLGGECLEARVHDAAGRPVVAKWWWVASKRLAIVETAQANGLAQLPVGRFHPFDLDTHGVGELIRHIAPFEPLEWFVGLGGSATNDGGIGMARALGWRFEAKDGGEIIRWTEMNRLHRCLPPVGGRIPGRVWIAVDVGNPLMGPLGCSRVYGPQKGLRPDDFPVADAAFEGLCRGVTKAVGRDDSGREGAGAAGGLGYGLAAFLDGTFRSGFELFEETVGLRSKIGWADVVVTGEGSMDASTRMGKGVGRVAQRCVEMGRKCYGVAGVTDYPEEGGGGFAGVRALTPGYVGREEALSEPGRHLRGLVARAVGGWVGC